MKVKDSRMEALKLIISSQEMCSQDQVLKALAREGYTLTQATLSRDLKQLKVAKAALPSGKYIYVLPNETMYKRITTPKRASEMMQSSGFVSINFSGQLAVIKTRPGYASAIAYDLDSHDLPSILGSIAGDDTIFLAIRMGATHEEVVSQLAMVIPDVK